MSSKLKNLEVQEVSLVDQPANPGAHIMILKSLGDLKKAQTFDDIIGIDEIRSSLMSMTWAFSDSIWSILDDEDVDQKALLAQTVTEFQTALSKMEILNMKEQLKKMGASDEVIALFDEQATKSETSHTALVSKMETLTTEIETLKAAAPADDNEGPDPIDKSDLPENVLKALEESDARVAKAEELNKANADKIAKMEEANEVSEFVTKAESFDKLSMSAEELGPILRSVSKSLDKDDYEKFDKMLTGLNEQISKGELFKSVGDDTGETDPTMDEVNKQAHEMVKKGEAKSIEAARAEIWKRDPDLRKQLN